MPAKYGAFLRCKVLRHAQGHVQVECNLSCGKDHWSVASHITAVPTLMMIHRAPDNMASLARRYHGSTTVGKRSVQMTASDRSPMKRLSWVAILVAASFIVARGLAFTEGLTHAIGANSSDVRAIKRAVIRLRRFAPASIDWYIAVEGRYAVAFAGCGPGACDENQLVREENTWVISCYTTAGKGHFGTCTMPPKLEQKLSHSALSLYHGP